MKMYLFKNTDFDLKVSKTKASEEIGLSRPYFTDVINGKKECSKLVAFCITKYLNKDSEISDYFIKKGE